MTISTELLAAAKNYLDITWTDEAADLKLTGQLKRGIDYIISKTGVDSSAFETEGREQELLFNYVLYDRSGSVDQFKVNYRSDLIGLRMRQEVESYAATSEA